MALLRVGGSLEVKVKSENYVGILESLDSKNEIFI